MSSKSLGNLTTTFTPTGTVNCFETFVAVRGNFKHQDKLLSVAPEGVSNEKACLPSNFRQGYENYYSPGVCIDGYTYALTSVDSSSSVATAICCPSGFQYHQTDHDLGPTAAFCTSSIDTAAVITVPYLEYGRGIDSPTLSSKTTTTLDAGQTFSAIGIVVQSGLGDEVVWGEPSTSSIPSATISIPAPTPDDANKSDTADQISPRKLKGIVAGASLGLAALLTVAFMVLWVNMRRSYERGKGDEVEQQQQKLASSRQVPSDKVVCSPEEPQEGLHQVHEVGTGPPEREAQELEAPQARVCSCCGLSHPLDGEKSLSEM